MNLNRTLVVLRGSENLAFLGGNGRVSLDDGGHDPAEGLDPQRERNHVEKKHVGYVSAEHARLDGGSHGNHFVRVYSLAWVLSEEVRHDFLHKRDPC